MPSDYYTSYIPFITATPKEDFIFVGSISRNKVGGRKLLPTSCIVLYIAEAMKNRTIPFVLVWFCFMLFNLSDAWAQSAESRTAEGQTEIKALKVGEKVPEEFWTREHVFYVQGDTIRRPLTEYRGKLLVLDFWATWCGACRHNFPKLELLKKEYKDNINFVLINPIVYRNNLQQLDKAYNDFKHNGGSELPSIVFDEYFVHLFPHVGIPRYIWIHANGRFIASTSNLFVSAEAIENILEGKY